MDVQREQGWGYLWTKMDNKTNGVNLVDLEFTKFSNQFVMKTCNFNQISLVEVSSLSSFCAKYCIKQICTHGHC